jgi:hypothetical protein
MKKTTPAVKYFVGKLKKVKYGKPYREFRRIVKVRSILGVKSTVRVDEVRMATGYVKCKVGYSQVSNLFATRDEARAEKHRWEGRKK